jgi:Fic family protein
MIEEQSCIIDKLKDIYTDIYKNNMKYIETHPWISFKVNLDTLPHTTWIRLGEAQSKCEQLSGVPLLPNVADELHTVYLAKGVLATTAIEGNTLTEREVRRIMTGELSLPPSKEYLGQEIQNILDACDDILHTVIVGPEPQLTVEQLKAYNRAVLKDLPLGEDVVAGEIRRYGVGVGRYLAPPADECEFLLQRFCDWLNQEVVLPTHDRILYSIVKAVVAHVYFAWIHPFGDGNGRTVRLIELQILLASGVPSVAAHLLSNHYNQTRAEYYRQLDSTSKRGGNLNSFILYATQGFVDGLNEQLEVVRDQQLLVHWHDYVYELFRDMDSATARRQRALVLDLTHSEPVALSKVRYISPRVAEAYSNRSDKTIQRDLDALLKLNLVQRRANDLYAANITLMLAFLPVVRSTEKPAATPRAKRKK